MNRPLGFTKVTVTFAGRSCAIAHGARPHHWRIHLREVRDFVPTSGCSRSGSDQCRTPRGSSASFKNDLGQGEGECYLRESGRQASLRGTRPIWAELTVLAASTRGGRTHLFGRLLSARVAAEEESRRRTPMHGCAGAPAPEERRRLSPRSVWPLDRGHRRWRRAGAVWGFVRGALWWLVTQRRVRSKS